MSDVTPPLMSNNFFGSEPGSSSEDELITMSTLRKILKQEIRVVMRKELEVMVLPIIHRVLVPIAEDLIRRIVKEQIELAVKKFFAGAQSNRENEQHTSRPRRLTLQFRNDLSLPILTGKEIRGKENDFLEVVLIDDLSGEIVESGPEAHAKVEIVALEGNEGEEESRTSEEVNNNISGERKDKKSLLSGDVVLTLNKGIGVLRNIKFIHASTWMKQDEYKLYARSVGTINGVHIREAKTEPFPVEDRRNELYRKCEVPDLSTKVWKLKNIYRKDEICKCVNTVEGFLRELFKDPDRLKNLAGMKPKKWEITVAHARTCTIDKRMSCYADSQKKMVVVFNLVEQVLGVVSGGQYIPIGKLSDDAKADAHKLAMDALDNLKDVVCFDDEASVLHYFSSLYASVDAKGSQELEHSRGGNTEASQMIGECSYNQLCNPNQATFSSTNSAGDTPSQMRSFPESINPFSMTDKQPHMEANFYQAPENIPRMELSDKEKAGVLEVPVHALDNRRDIVSDDEASLHENISSTYTPMAPTSSREMEHPKGGTSSATHPVPQSTNAHNVMDDQFHTEIPAALESLEGGLPFDNDNFCLGSSPLLYAPADHTSSQGLEGGLLFDNDNFCLRSSPLLYAPADHTRSQGLEGGLLFDNDNFHLGSSPSLYAPADHTSSQGLEGGFLFDNDNFCLGYSPLLYAPADHTSSQGLEQPRGHDTEASGGIGECSTNSHASSHDNTHSINFGGDTPREVQPGLHCTNDFNLMDDQQLTERATISASLETMMWDRHDKKQIAAANMMPGARPSKAWVMLINVLSFRREALRTKTYERLLQYLLVQYAFAVLKKRRVQ